MDYILLLVVDCILGVRFCQTWPVGWDAEEAPWHPFGFIMRIIMFSLDDVGSGADERRLVLVIPGASDHCSIKRAYLRRQREKA